MRAFSMCLALAVLLGCERVGPLLSRELVEQQGSSACPNPQIETRTLATTQLRSEPRIAVVGGELVVVWAAEGSVPSAIYMLRLDAFGAPSGQARELGAGLGPAVASDGVELGISWVLSSPGAVRFNRFDLGGTMLGTSLELSSAAEPVTSLAYGNGRYAVSWLDRATSAWGYVALVDSSGSEVSPGRNMCNDGDCFSIPVTALGPNGWGLAWHNDGLPGFENLAVAFRLLSPAGDVASTPTPISTSLAYDARIVFDGAGFAVGFVAVRDGQTHYDLARLDSAGVTSHANLDVAAGQISNPDLLWDGARYIVTWRDATDAQPTAALSLAFVDATGVVSPPLLLGEVSSTEIRTRAELVTLNDEYFAVWRRPQEGAPHEIVLARLSCR